MESTLCEWQSHWLHDWSLILTLDGRGTIVLGENSVGSETGTMVLIAPEHPHLFRPEPGWDLIWFHFLMRPHLMAELRWPEQVAGLRGGRLAGAEFRRAKAALLEASQLDHRRPPNWHGLAYALLEETVLRGCTGTAEGRDDGEWLARAQKLLLQGPVENPSVDRAAALCGMSRTKFYTAFKRAAGISPRVWRESQLLRRAQFLLQGTSLPVAEIARQLGMRDPFYFSSRFRRFCGLSPTEYRQSRQAAGTGKELTD